MHIIFFVLSAIYSTSSIVCRFSEWERDCFSSKETYITKGIQLNRILFKKLLFNLLITITWWPSLNHNCLVKWQCSYKLLCGLQIHPLLNLQLIQLYFCFAIILLLYAHPKMTSVLVLFVVLGGLYISLLLYR